MTQLQREPLSSNELVAFIDTGLAWPAVSTVCVYVLRLTPVGHQPGAMTHTFLDKGVMCVCESFVQCNIYRIPVFLRVIALF